MFPLKSIHPEAYDKSHAILCQDTNEKALQMLEDAYAKKKLPKPDCPKRPIERTMVLGTSLGINSTPTFIFMDGSRINGAVSKEELIKAIDERKPEKK